MKKHSARWQLVIYDLLILLAVDLLLVFYQGKEELPLDSILIHAAISCVCFFTTRILGGIYRQIRRIEEETIWKHPGNRAKQHISNGFVYG